MYHVFDIAKAVSDKNRVCILLALTKHSEICVRQFQSVLGVSMATVSNHIAVLESAGLITGNRYGRWICYRIADNADNDILSWLRKHLIDSGDFDECMAKFDKAVAEACPELNAIKEKIGEK